MSFLIFQMYITSSAEQIPFTIDYLQQIVVFFTFSLFSYVLIIKNTRLIYFNYSFEAIY